ncbi:hypothetical protein OIU91_02985 [Streptomyces sp. NBC_01456]|nr:MULTISPECIES: hypothetical protein [unclassified Streptomyces]
MPAPTAAAGGFESGEGGYVVQGNGGGPVGAAVVAGGEVEYEVPAGRGEVLDDDEGVGVVGTEAVTPLELGDVAGLGTVGVSVA